MTTGIFRQSLVEYVVIMVSIRELIDIYNDLNNAIFFDGLSEFVKTREYTDDEWKNKANQFLSDYQKLLEANSTIAKYDYLLHMKEDEEMAYYAQVASENNQSISDVLNENKPEEPFDGYFGLIRKMSIPFNALKKTQREIGDYSVSSALIIEKDTKENFGPFDFILNNGEIVGIQYNNKKLKLQPKDASTFLCIMRKCYGNTSAISIDEIKEFNKKPADNEKNIRTQTSTINGAIRNIAHLNKSDKLIVNANEIAPCMFKLNNNLLVRI